MGLVIVSHSARLAEGVVELAREMAGADVPIAAAGGLDEPGDPIGTDAVRVMAAVEEVTGEGRSALVLMDLGSAVLSAETALDLLDDEVRARTMLCEAPLVEGAVAAAAAARAGGALEDVAREARNGLAGKAAHLGMPPSDPDRPAAAEGGGDGWTGLEAVVRAAHGLHARPAAAVVRAAADRAAEVRIRNLTTGAGPADARSLTGLSALGALDGHRVLIEARGEEARQALDAVREIVEEAEEGERPTPPAPAPTPPAPTPARAPQAGDELQGVAASPGLGSGPAHVRGAAAALPDAPEGDPPAERAALREALAAAARELEAIRAGATAETADILGAQILLLGDSALLDAADGAIDAGAPAARAWHDATADAAAAYERLDDPYLRARSADVLDVGRRVAGILTGGPATGLAGVLVAPELGAAEVAGLDAARVTAIVMAASGPTAHAAIIARALGIPAVTGLGGGILAVAEGTPLLVDGTAGTVVADPSAARMAAYEARVADEAAAAGRAAAHAHEPARTRDGCVVEVAANIGAPGDLEQAVAGGADGVGLLRTEFLFLNRTSAPDEDEQYRVYAEAVRRLEGRRLVLRTLDAGADKPLAYLPMPVEENPFLGVRGIRLSLQRPAMLTAQLRAALRAAAEGPVGVMFPMIAERAELTAARALLDAAAQELRDEGLPMGDVEVGAMVEVPAAALLTDIIAPEVAFLSIGTNDLTQYTMAAERGNAGVAGLSDPLHPAVLRLISRVATAGGARGCRIAVCGEAASDLLAVPLLVGLGVDELSVTPRRVGAVKERVRGLDMPSVRALAQAALDLPDAAAVRRLVSAGTVGG